MGKKQTADGRWIIGGGENSTDYKGFLHWRECYICLAESGATEESVNYLNALKEYAFAHYALGEPIMPPSMTVWVVANGKAVAVQADDVKIEGGDYTICGITYSDGAWDYSNAGQGGGGSSLPAVTAEDNGDVLTVVDGAWGKTDAPYTVEDSTTRTVIFAADTVTLKNGGQANLGDFLSCPSEGDTIEVVWDGVSYECVTEAFLDGSVKCGAIGILAGSPDWSVYPFCLILPPVTSGGGIALAENDGSVTLAINKITGGIAVDASTDFIRAVNYAKAKTVISDATVNVDEDSGNGIVPTSVDISAYLGDSTEVTVDGKSIPWVELQQEWYLEDGDMTYEVLPYSGVVYLYVSKNGETVAGDYAVKILGETASSGGGGPLFVVYTDDSGDYSCDTTLATIGEALENGTPIIVTLKGSGYQMTADNLSVVGGSSFVSEFHLFDAKQNYFEVKILSITHAVGDSVTGSLTTKTLQYFIAVN